MPTTEPKFIGTISHGTLLTYDLAVAFLDVIRELAPAAYQQLTVVCGMTPDYLRALDEGRNAEYWASEEAAWFVEDLSDALSAHAPEGFYFGAHDGDGTDFGFWPED